MKLNKWNPLADGQSRAALQRRNLQAQILLQRTQRLNGSCRDPNHGGEGMVQVHNSINTVSANSYTIIWIVITCLVAAVLLGLWWGHTPKRQVMLTKDHGLTSYGVLLEELNRAQTNPVIRTIRLGTNDLQVGVLEDKEAGQIIYYLPGAFSSRSVTQPHSIRAFSLFEQDRLVIVILGDGSVQQVSLERFIALLESNNVRNLR